MRANKPVTSRSRRKEIRPKWTLTVADKNGLQKQECLFWVDLQTYQPTLLAGNLPPACLRVYQQEPFHQRALQQAKERGMYHYEWAMQLKNQTVWFQSSCVAFVEPDGEISRILVFMRDISNWAGNLLPQTGFHDWAAPQTFSQILLAARETEKREISKALHDEVGSSAVMLTALLSLVKASVIKKNTAQALRDIAQLDMQIKGMIERLRNIIVSLRPPTLDNQGGLGGAVRDLLDHISSLARLPYTFDYKGEDQNLHLTDNVKILLYRIVQESLTNIVKHARAKRIKVALKATKTQVCLRVQDDGIGFNPQQSVSLEHVGLLAMKDSVELLGGTLHIKSAPGKGTRIEVVCPSIVYGGKES